MYLYALTLTLQSLLAVIVLFTSVNFDYDNIRIIYYV